MPEEIVPITPAAEPQMSLADHEATFAPATNFAEAVAQAEPVISESDDLDDTDVAPPSGPAPTRHRAASQQAKPEDAAAIADLTKRVRTAEKELGIERKPGESQRVFNLRKQAEMAELLTKRPTSAAVVQPPASQPIAPQSAFAEAEPTQAQFMTAADPYAAFVSAHTRWEWRKEQAETQQATAKTEQERDFKARQEKFTGWVKSTEDSHASRLTAFIAQKPEIKAELEAAGNLDISKIMYGAAVLHERGPEFMVEYARHPELVDELLLQTTGKELIQPDGSVNPLVAIVQRRLLSRLSAVTTGSATPRVITSPTARPPNPVRTAPQTPSATPPGDGASLAQHESFYGPKRRR